MTSEALDFWEQMFRESGDQGWPQAYIAIPTPAYDSDRLAIKAAAKKNGFARVLFTGDKQNVHYCRYI